MPYEEFDSELSEVTESEEDTPAQPTKTGSNSKPKEKDGSYEIQNALKGT
jgi:hypothetical protein